MKRLVVIACLVVTMVAAVRKEVISINIFFTKIITFIVKITIVIQIFVVEIISNISFTKTIILINTIKVTTVISTMMQVELMAGGRMSLGWEFKEERLHFTLVSWQIIY